MGRLQGGGYKSQGRQAGQKPQGALIGHAVVNRYGEPVAVPAPTASGAYVMGATAE